jgi:hypothetical protein
MGSFWFWNILLVSVLTLSPSMAFAISVKPSINAKYLTVGDKFVYRNEVPTGSAVEPLQPEGKLGDATVLSPVFKFKNQRNGMDIYACTLAVYQPGDIKIPTFTFKAANSSDTTLSSGDTLRLNIASVLPPDTTGLKMADIREPKRLRGPIWPYIVAPIALALIVLGIRWLRNKFRKKVTGPIAPPIPPWDMAFKRLDELKGARHIEFGRFKQFYFELSLVIRGYIEQRYDTLAVESTTIELENDAMLYEMESGLRDKLFDMFHGADLAKFAKSIPTVREAESDLSFAYDFVIRTKPAPVAIDGEKVAEEVKA